ncbi:hypothetical protein FHS18_004502 [Paenibacillus phyllosphaerae]|uniref:MoaF-like domain-containing protein n=1 Tax=Paenibacillus phyllosphaerae TaxID=274593 RepID=A0A7W5B2E6_9BACL|nr:hypothetical protein [Paenibacillus phyllosphaerae]MBB3112401.1 hypothetical protein [Paenibacillus phyllosphaerae]
MHHPHVQNVHPKHPIPFYAGKVFRYDYDDGNVFIIHFFDAHHRHDEGIAGQHKGYKGYYQFNYVEIAPHVYFMYWLEEIYTVSQVVDFNRMHVYTHYTYDYGGVRQSLFHSGKVTQLHAATNCNSGSSYY